MGAFFMLQRLPMPLLQKFDLTVSLTVHPLVGSSKLAIYSSTSRQMHEQSRSAQTMMPTKVSICFSKQARIVNQHPDLSAIHV
ncbi:hypothetical protein [Cohaesibacter marisflavi]|uniref:hypothetical protein n=1 Tax=Cohaesibacter marisflavi TaxID=655353 RepID=UPI000B7EA72F|nr:hypothetical protein [Cohaesibacter marisflavi]